MNKQIPIFGAKAQVNLRYDGELQALAEKLTSCLVHVPFQIENRESEPYDLIGSCEALGFEMWLEKINSDHTTRQKIMSNFQ